MKRFLLMIAMIFAGCVNPPEKKEYVPFECSYMPEERTYFPEESLEFHFNMDINPLSREGFSAVSSISGSTLPFKIEKNAIFLTPPLPANDTIVIVITSGLKSIDNRPLQIGGSFTEEKKTITAQYMTGNPLPAATGHLPESSKSASVAIKFSSPVQIKKTDIDPEPEKVISFDEWHLFIFKKPEKTVLIKKASPPDRDEVIENIEINLPDKEPAEEDADISYEATDSSISVNISDDSAVAAVVNGSFSICDKKCTIVIGDLEPSKKYDLSIEIYSTTGTKYSDSYAFTEAPAPHIMITEIMHTPAGEPEKNFEFVEIFNHGELDFDLTGCFIDDRNDGSGRDPLSLKNVELLPVLGPGMTAVITGNEAGLSSISSDSLWFAVDDTTIADAGLTSNESVQIICLRNEEMIIEDSFDPSGIDCERGYSVNVDSKGTVCISAETGGTPGIYYECP